MKIVLAPDSFKGNLTSLQVATALEKGVKRVIPKANCIKVPMADGGEGTVHALIDAKGGRLVSKRVTGPMGVAIVARYGMLDDGETAVIEMAEASGLPKIPDVNDKNPMVTTTYGTGELILDAINKGAKHIILGLGGSATIDGGAGVAQALGVRLLDKKGKELEEFASGGMLNKVASIDASGLDPQIRKIRVTLAGDVDNVLCGRKGAAHVFGVQKGATPAMVKKLDANLKHFASIVKRDLHKNVLRLKGTGAAGGLGVCLLAVTRARFKSGVDIVIDATELAQHVRGAYLVMTGEGCVDAQTAFGKTPAGVARVAKKYGVPTIVIGGGIADNANSLFEHGMAGLASACAREMSLQEAMAHSRAHLANSAERVMRLVMIGKKITQRKNSNRKQK